MQSTRGASKKKSNLTLEKFTTISVIGKGSYGKVFLVRGVTDGKLYAMKVLNKERVESKRQETHVKTERDVLVEANNSPFLVGFAGSFQTSSKLYFVLEYCAGGELFQYLQRCKKFEESAARFYAAQIVLALEYLHRRNIIYRDLKPENVLIGADGYIKISDFGLSRTNTCGDEAKSILGTPEYLAPEVLMKMGYGRAVDWWTFGSLVYEMLTGFPPFYSNSRNRNELFEKIKFVTPRYPAALTPAAKAFLEGLLHKDPGQRLGAGGADEVKAHVWFRGVNFDEVIQKRLPPPFVPVVDHNLGLQNFDKEFTEISLVSPDFGGKNCRDFEGFTWEDRVSVETSCSMQIEREERGWNSTRSGAVAPINFNPILEEKTGRMVED